MFSFSAFTYDWEMEVTFSWWSCPVQATLPRSPASLPITTGPWSLLPGKAGPTRAHEWGTPPSLGYGCYRPKDRESLLLLSRSWDFSLLAEKRKWERESTWLVHVKEMAIRGGLWAASQPLCAGTHLVQCVTELHWLQQWMVLIHPVVCAHPPLRCSGRRGDRNPFSGSSFC